MGHGANNFRKTNNIIYSCVKGEEPKNSSLFKSRYLDFSFFFPFLGGLIFSSMPGIE